MGALLVRASSVGATQDEWIVLSEEAAFEVFLQTYETSMHILEESLSQIK